VRINSYAFASSHIRRSKLACTPAWQKSISEQALMTCRIHCLDLTQVDKVSLYDLFPQVGIVVISDAQVSVTDRSMVINWLRPGAPLTNTTS
jgi:hypothetical protein